MNARSARTKEWNGRCMACLRRELCAVPLPGARLRAVGRGLGMGRAGQPRRRGCPPFDLRQPATVRLRTIKMSAAGGDIERVEAGPAETTFVRQVGRKRMALDDGALGREDVDQRARAVAPPAADRDDVAVLVET